MTACVRRHGVLRAFVLCSMVMTVSVASLRADTLRSYLDSAKVPLAASAPGAPELDRQLTSSSYGVTDSEFIAAYYYQDESANERLGPLHLSRFDRRRGLWGNAPDIDGDLARLNLTRGGSVLGVVVEDRVILIETHMTPSANMQLVVDRDLKPLGAFCGFDTHAVQSDIFFVGCMVHFAPEHKEHLRTLSLADFKEHDIFPGDARWPVASRAPEYFDIFLSHITPRDDSLRVVALANYSCCRGGDTVPPDVETVIVCDRDGSEWSCRQTLLPEFATRNRTTIRRGQYGTLSDDSASQIIGVAMRQP